MSFADSLKSPDEVRKETLAKIEQDPRPYAEKVADEVGYAVRRSAEEASRAGKKSVVGYVASYNDDGYTEYKLAPGIIGQFGVKVVDKIYVDSGRPRDYDSTRLWQGQEEAYHANYQKGMFVTVSENVLKCVAAAAREKLKELGFRQYAVKLKRQEFISEKEEKGFLGIKQTVRKPCGAGVLLWIEVNW